MLRRRLLGWRGIVADFYLFVLCTEGVVTDLRAFLEF